MIAALLTLHVVGLAVILLAGPRLGRRSLLVAGVAPLVTAVWLITRIGAEQPSSFEVVWVPELDLALSFRLGPVAVLMSLLVAGIGALVFVYAYGYFDPGTPGVGRFSASLLAFATAMLGLAWSESVWTLFVFWELTSITSYLLVGHKHPDDAVRLAARRALMITAAGGLALLAGLVVLVDVAGTANLSELAAVGGTSGIVAAVLILVAAATKSAQVPFHVWLPGAMAAPTPVSAYLHSATMVKAGVLVVALLAPALSATSVWSPLGVAIGGASMLWGAVGALRHVDAKLILAWGTVSQLGLMIVLLTLGNAKATFAGVAMLLAHAIFKAALFMVVGEIDVRTGTRRIDQLGGLWRSMPVAAVTAVLAGASMAGLPPLLGFATKEAAIEAVLRSNGAELWVVGAIVFGGSVLTVAYTVRLLAGLFGPGERSVVVSPRRPWMEFPAALLSLVSVGGFVAIGQPDRLVGLAAFDLDPAAASAHLLRWPGPSTALLVSTIIVTIGAALGWSVPRRSADQVPRTIGADTVDGGLDGVIVIARRITARVQHGSLPVYVVTMTGVAALATVPFVGSVDLGLLYRWDHPVQAVLGVVIVAAAVVAATIRSRLGAALGLGAVGVGAAGLFAVHGAPDLVLTQLLVETVVVAGFVLGLRGLSRGFPAMGASWRAVRIGVSVVTGVMVAVALAASAPRDPDFAAVDQLVDSGRDVGGGNNIVNVILTDIRALDTLGEVVVLLVAAVGVLALGAAGRAEEAS